MKKVLFGLLIISVLILTACGSRAQWIEDEKAISDSINEERAQQDNQVEEKKSIFSNDITSGSKDLLPTLDDFEMGWEMVLDEQKDSSTWDQEDQDRAKNNGFIEGHYRGFQIGSGNIADFDTTQLIEFSISLYSKDKIKNVLQHEKDLVDEGDYYYTDYKEELNDDMEFEEVEVEIDVEVSKLKNPSIGDDSIFYSETEDLALGKIKTYYLSFIEKNVFVRVKCKALDTEKSINNCIEYAELVSKKI